MMKWQEKRPMTGDEYLKALKMLKLNHASIGRFLDYSERQSQRYAKGKSPIPRTLAMLLRVLLLFGVRL